jgi:hypothetical protein
MITSGSKQWREREMVESVIGLEFLQLDNIFCLHTSIVWCRILPLPLLLALQVVIRRILRSSRNLMRTPNQRLSIRMLPTNQPIPMWRRKRRRRRRRPPTQSPPILLQIQTLNPKHSSSNLHLNNSSNSSSSSSSLKLLIPQTMDRLLQGRVRRRERRRRRVQIPPYQLLYIPHISILFIINKSITNPWLTQHMNLLV